MFTKWLISFLLPIGWTIILYPLARKYRKAYPFLLISVVLLSLAVLVSVEFFKESQPIIGNIAVYLVGIFFGITLLSVLFILQTNWLGSMPDSASAAPESQSAMPLRHLLQLGIILEEEGRKFYEEQAKKVTNENVRVLYTRLAQDEIKHKEFIERILYQWLPLNLDDKSIDLCKMECKKRGFFQNPPAPNATEKEVLKFAISQEERTVQFFRDFEANFPEAWKRMHIEMLVKEELEHAAQLSSLLAKAS